MTQRSTKTNSIEFLALRKLQQDHKATDFEVAQFLDLVNSGNGDFEAVFEIAMIEVADDCYRPEGQPPLPSWCAACGDNDDDKIGRLRSSRP